MAYIFSDLNVRSKQINTDDVISISDTDAIKQSILRLLGSREGSFPYFRAYGLTLEKYLHYPLNSDTADLIYKEMVDKINTFEQRATVMDDYCILTVDYNNQRILVDLVLQCKNSKELFTIPTQVINMTGT